MPDFPLAAVLVPFNDDAVKITDLRWSDGEQPTRIAVASRRSGRSCIVEFDAVIGLRMLDELDLASTWHGMPADFLKSSWLFAVKSGGWFDLEATRPDFYTQHVLQKPTEFLVAGFQECVSVLAPSFPRILEIGSDA